jgi:hypothetical protein
MLSELPKGYKSAHRMISELGSIQEFIPEGETLAHWTEMLTVQILRRRQGWTLSDFRTSIDTLWDSICLGGSSQLVEQGFEQLQPTMIWSLTCPQSWITGRPEYTWIKIVMQKGYLVVIQKAFTFKPSANSIAFWISYLRDVRANDVILMQ